MIANSENSMYKGVWVVGSIPMFIILNEILSEL